MSDGPESEMEMALARIASLPPIVDPRDAVAAAAVRWLDANDQWSESYDRYGPLWYRMLAERAALRAAVAAYRAATTPTARPGAEA